MTTQPQNQHWQNQVKEFMLKAGQECPLFPTIPEDKVTDLRVNLIAEELHELSEALMHQRDLVEVADAIADLLVVTLGTAVACGIDINPIFEEVMRSNMTKFIDGYKREDGKWIKGPSYTPANIEPLIDKQLNPPIQEIPEAGSNARELGETKYLAIISDRLVKDTELDLVASRFPTELFKTVPFFSTIESHQKYKCHDDDGDVIWCIIDLRDTIVKNPDKLKKRVESFADRKFYISNDLNQLSYYTSEPNEQYSSWENLVKRNFFIS